MSDKKIPRFVTEYLDTMLSPGDLGEAKARRNKKRAAKSQDWVKAIVWADLERKLKKFRQEPPADFSPEEEIQEVPEWTAIKKRFNL